MHACLRSCFRRLPSYLHALEPTSSSGPLPFKRGLLNSAVTTAQSIRNAVANGEGHQGYQLFTKFYTNEYQHEIHSSLSERNARPNSPYLAHVLIHALYRSEKLLSAASVTKMCMERGIKIRRHTFTTVFAGISPPCDPNAPIPRPKRAMDSPSFLSITTAIGLLKAARRSGHKHQSWMYDRVINALLLQGEVLTATFLFITLFKEWNARRRAKAVSEAHSLRETPSHEAETTLPTPVVGRPRSVNKSYLVEPPGIWVRKITASLEEKLCHSIVDEKETYKRRALDALVALAKLLEEEHQYIPNNWRILQLLRSALSARCLDDATSDEIHRTLMVLCRRSGTRAGLDLLSYHTLLRYALQDEKSIDLGADVLRALVESHDPTLVTYNILLRDISRLGDVATVEAVARLLNARNCFSMGPLLAKSTQLAEKKIIDCLSSLPVPLLDEHAVVNMMTHAIARGDPQAACTFLLQIFPGLNDSESRSGKHQAPRTVVKQADKFSPRFWATAQRAAAKANRMRLSMGIWRLVMRVERMRYRPQNGDLVPCLYSAMAYTSQFQLFSTRLRKIYKTIQELPADKTDVSIQEQIQTLYARYNQTLEYVRRILVSLRERSLGDRTTEKTVIAGFDFDERLVKALLMLVEHILRIEQQQLPALAHRAAVALQKEASPEEHNEYARPRRILGIVRKILYHHGVAHPSSLEELGFNGYANGTLPPQPHALSRPNESSKRQQKNPAFKVKYSADDLLPKKRPKGANSKPKAHPHRVIGGDITKRFIRMLERAEKATAKGPVSQDQHVYSHY